MEQTSVTQESKGFYKLNWLQRIGFGSGDLAQNLIYQTICMYLLFFYTDIYGLNPGVAATMFLVVRLVDVLWDPLVGTYVDKHNPRWGKYRSYLVLAGLPLTVLAILCFWNGMEGQTETIKLIYAYVTYVGLSMIYTLINVPYGALNSSLTRDTDEITILTSVRMFMANVGGLCVSAGVPILVAMLAAAKDLPIEMALFMGLGSLPSFIFMPLVPAIKKYVLHLPYCGYRGYGDALYHQQDGTCKGSYHAGLYRSVHQINRRNRSYRIYVGFDSGGYLFCRIYQRQAYCRHRQCPDRYLL